MVLEKDRPMRDLISSEVTVTDNFSNNWPFRSSERFSMGETRLTRRAESNFGTKPADVMFDVKCRRNSKIRNE